MRTLSQGFILIPVVDKLFLLAIFKSGVEVGPRVNRIHSRRGIFRCCGRSILERTAWLAGSRMTSCLRLICLGVAESGCRKLMNNVFCGIHLKSASGWAEGIVYSVDTACRVVLVFVSEKSRSLLMMTLMVHIDETYLQMAQTDRCLPCWCCVTTSG
ncbi:hypothetical protein FOXG_17842 [Fusarium oxysporum f. sp. lycopersici 4287]|uniref:Secreted protein n=1 Tax=Fusarium oxysporum f. sp. lycopersici (strain 4287 / CBS 123668 / FGSC 9935 / NRRL 34936) TaxID=426428 RepID=A0A0J9U4Z0_FUSO4|nr:hypothetical protein FOXG_17842 [Fusarium oxysporum f. sp. lycopersici 4287]KAI8418872.1 hypothetical protein FOFC_01444 [Fusarium oxysporum]KNA94034.1 hypothetical protein FOXG_17842 [Fusarium oxysporum f. sp. lycopersici 4287]